MGASSAAQTPTPFDHLPAGRWARIEVSGARDGDLLALRPAQGSTCADEATPAPSCWVWRLSAADIVRPRAGSTPPNVIVHGLGPAFVIGGRPGEGPGWELWKFYPDAPAPRPVPTPAPAPGPAPTDELAARRAQRLSPAHPAGRYRRFPPQDFFDQDSR